MIKIPDSSFQKAIPVLKGTFNSVVLISEMDQQPLRFKGLVAAFSFPGR